MMLDAPSARALVKLQVFAPNFGSCLLCATTAHTEFSHEDSSMHLLPCSALSNSGLCAMPQLTYTAIAFDERRSTTKRAHAGCS
jgi:hypothetical protein